MQLEENNLIRKDDSIMDEEKDCIETLEDEFSEEAIEELSNNKGDED